MSQFRKKDQLELIGDNGHKAQQLIST